MNTDPEVSRLRYQISELRDKVRRLESENALRRTSFHFFVMMAGAFFLFYWAVKGL